MFRFVGNAFKVKSLFANFTSPNLNSHWRTQFFVVRCHDNDIHCVFCSLLYFKITTVLINFGEDSKKSISYISQRNFRESVYFRYYANTCFFREWTIFRFFANNYFCKFSILHFPYKHKRGGE